MSASFGFDDITIICSMNSAVNLVPRVSLTLGATKKRGPGNEVAIVPS